MLYSLLTPDFTGYLTIETKGQPLAVGAPLAQQLGDPRLQNLAGRYSCLQRRNPPLVVFPDLPREITSFHFYSATRTRPSGGGRIHFNLAELDSSRGGLTAHELEHVCGSPVIRAATTFYGGPAPC